MVLGVFLLLAGLTIVKFPDILQYALASVLIVSGVSAILGSLGGNAPQQHPSEPETRGADFRKLED
tara:strand:- start:170 stop:367 length:198 start_codon:yes stop_codon:yes gene_type:complete